jgi:hypothetical protein
VARELADVIHYFLSDREGGIQRERPAPARERSEPPTAEPDRPLSLITIPVAEKDVIRVAFVWNLAVELARAGGRPMMLAPDDPGLEPLRECLPSPNPEAQALGPEFAFSGATSLGALARDARELVRQRRSDAGPALALVPSRWIRPQVQAEDLLGTTLLFTTPELADLNAAYALVERIALAAPRARVGVTIHGVGSVDEARRTYDRLAARVENGLGRTLVSYGLLLEDLQIYRAVVNRHPVGLARPQSLAAQGLADVARLLRVDAGAQEAAGGPP